MHLQGQGWADIFIIRNGPPDPARGYQGEVWAEISIGGTGYQSNAFWSVSRSTTVEEGGGWETTSVVFPGVSITPGQTYNLFIGWDGSQFTFTVTEGETPYTDHYTTPPTVYPPGHNNKGLSTRISPQSSPPPSYEASISATFDDVVINGTGIPVDGSWLVDMSGATKGGAVFDCFAGKLSGYGFAKIWKRIRSTLRANLTSTLREHNRNVHRDHWYGAEVPAEH